MKPLFLAFLLAGCACGAPNSPVQRDLADGQSPTAETVDRAVAPAPPAPGPSPEPGKGNRGHGNGDENTDPAANGGDSTDSDNPGRGRK